MSYDQPAPQGQVESYGRPQPHSWPTPQTPPLIHHPAAPVETPERDLIGSEDGMGDWLYLRFASEDEHGEHFQTVYHVHN